MRKSLATFWWMPEDENAFLDHLEKRFEIVAFLDEWKERREDVVPLDFRSGIHNGVGSALIFGRADHLVGDIISSHEFPVLGIRYSVMAEKACVFWYRGGQRRADGKLTLCTIGAYWDNFDEKSRTVTPKPPEFQKWGRSLLRWVRERTPEKEGYYRCSLFLKEALEARTVEIATY